MSTKPTILIVDDKPDEERVRVGELSREIKTVIEHPQDVTEYDLRTADLVLVDYRLDYWPSRDNASSIALKPVNGLALAAMLREQACKNRNQSPTAFAIRSAHLDELSGDLPPDYREQAIARTHNLEWAFPKTRNSWDIPVFDQIISLARSVRQLPASWPQSSAAQSWDLINKLLDIPEESWMLRAQEDVEECHPPVHELSDASHGLAFLRWLLHQILPYPCFLWDTYYLAARFRITHASLLRAFEEDNGLRDFLGTSEYKGLLAGFIGPRWWRSGVETLIWHITDGDPFNVDLVRSKLTSQITGNLESIEYTQPVVCVDRQYRPLSTLSRIEDAVRIQPDDWPPYADQAWTTIELAKREPVLHALVVSQDRNRLA